MNVLLVHGFWDTGKTFRRLECRLAAAGHTCWAPTLYPRDGRLGITDLARKLSEYVAKNLPVNLPFAVVGFSMGCLVARCYLQQLQPDRPARAFFAISGPFRGTLTAWLYPSQGARDMRPGSEFLRQLDATADTLWEIPVYTYYTPRDLMIIPAASSRLPLATELMVWSPLHRWMLASEKISSDILDRLKGL
ncbi:MAG: alpha/beta hydrolase [Verrucomicrobiota bacterium]|jgi:triacylglycerol lipase